MLMTEVPCDVSLSLDTMYVCTLSEWIKSWSFKLLVGPCCSVALESISSALVNLRPRRVEDEVLTATSAS